MAKTISCGVPYLDKVMGGFFLGDNVVWALEPGTYFDVYLERFLTARERRRFRTIYVSFDFPPQKILARYAPFFKPEDFMLVDAFTHGKGKGDNYFQSFYNTKNANSKGFRISCIQNLDDPSEFIDTMRTIQEEFKTGPACKYFFGSLTGMQEIWGERDTLHFFTYTCPKLFELKALAYWPLVKEAHSKAFFATMSYITQIVISLKFQENRKCAVQFLKLEGRPSQLLNIQHYYTVNEKDISFADPDGSTIEEKFGTRRISPVENADDYTGVEGLKEPLRVGDRIRNFRKDKNISQVELARKLNITPSALSQIENNQSLPSLTLFVEIARLLGKSLDGFFTGAPPPGSKS